jgi:hypothetical protein
MVLTLTLSGCTTSISQTNYIDAGGHDCLKTLKKVAPLGIVMSEKVECSVLISSHTTQPYETTFQKTRKRHWFFLWLF